jgi:hypothetical protein
MAADIYVDANGDDSTGASWATAYQSYENASVTGAAAGDIIWVAHDHNEVLSGAKNPDWANGTNASPIRIISVNSGTDAYASRGATIGGSTSFVIAGCVEMYGMNLSSGVGDMFLCDDNLENQIYDDCDFNVGTGNGDDMFCAGTDVTLIIRNSTLHLWDQLSGSGADGSYNQFINCDIQNDGSATALLNNAENRSRWLFLGCDLSDWTSATALTEIGTSITVSECITGASFTMHSGTVTDSIYLLLERSKNGNDATILGLQELTCYEGIIKGDLTRYRTGGASDGAAGANSWQMDATGGNALAYYRPLRSPWGVRWVAGGSEVIMTFHIAGATDLTDDEFWIELITPDDTATSTQQSDVRSSILGNDKSATGKGDPLATPASTNLVRSSTTWTGSGTGIDGSTGQQKIIFTFTPDQAGPCKFRACLATSANVIYFDPKVVVS